MATKFRVESLVNSILAPVSEHEAAKKPGIDLCPRCGSTSIRDYAPGWANCSRCGYRWMPDVFMVGAPPATVSKFIREWGRRMAAGNSDEEIQSELTSLGYPKDIVTAWNLVDNNPAWLPELLDPLRREGELPWEN
jgi:ribosomal protein L37AE/L43A